MPDYDPKNIPVLDNIIDDENDDIASLHEKIIIDDEMHVDNNTPDMFNEVTAEIEIDDAQPEIGIIDHTMDQGIAPVIGEEISVNSNVIETQTEPVLNDEIHVEDSISNASDVPEFFKPVFINYSYQETVKQNLVQETNRDEQKESAVVAQPAIKLDLDSIIDDVVTQMMPELEQQLRTRLKQALQESLPQKVSAPAASE